MLLKLCINPNKEDFTSSKNFRVNERIRIPEVRVVDEDGTQLGVLKTKEAIDRAYDAGLDLVEVAPNSRPPVARIMDFSKFKYDQNKKEREAKKKQHVTHVKTIRLKPKIEEHDYQVKLKNLNKFLAKGDKVKVSMMFRGRQMVYTDNGREVLNRMAADASALGELSLEPKLEGRFMNMVLIPKKAA